MVIPNADQEALAKIPGSHWSSTWSMGPRKRRGTTRPLQFGDAPGTDARRVEPNRR
jgi:hypothetical protein